MYCALTDDAHTETLMYVAFARGLRLSSPDYNAVTKLCLPGTRKKSLAPQLKGLSNRFIHA
jgi:hypothetical protein